MRAWDVLADDGILTKALQEFGGVSLNPFYSNPEHTLHLGTLYVAGLNPGGDLAAIPSQLEEKPLDHPQRVAERDDWCKPLDEHWGTNYQANVLNLADMALPGGAEALRQAFCTEALFMRGAITGNVDVEGLWDVCRRWHVEWLGKAQPRAILCLGNGVKRSPYAWLGGLLDGFRQVQQIETYSTFSVKVGQGTLNGQTVSVIGLPHPAHWFPSAPRSCQAVDRVRELVHERRAPRGRRDRAKA